MCECVVRACSVMFTHLVLILARLAVVVVFLRQKCLRFLIHQLVKQHGQERCSKGHSRVEIDGLPGRESFIEEGAHLDTHSDRWVGDGAIGCHCCSVSVEHSTSSNVASGQNEAVDGLFVAEEELFIGVGHKEEDIDERAEQLLEESAQEKVVNKSELREFKCVEVQ